MEDFDEIYSTEKFMKKVEVFFVSFSYSTCVQHF